MRDLGKLQAAAPSTLSLPASFLGYRVKGVFYGWNPAHGHLLQSPPSCPSYVPLDNINNSGREWKAPAASSAPRGAGTPHSWDSEAVGV